MFKDETGEIVPAIVSEELWDKANAVLKRRSDDVKSRQGICNHANLLTGKLFCTCCGTPYYRRDSQDRKGNKNSKWICSGKIKGGAESCDSFAIYEEEIKPILFEVFRETEVNVNALMAEYEEMYRLQDADNQLVNQIEQQKQRLDIAQKKKSKLLEFNVTGQLSDEEYLAMNKECAQEIKDAKAQIQELEQQLFSREEFRKHMEPIRKTMENARRDAAQGMITAEFVSRYIDRIFVTPVAENCLQLEIRIFTGEATRKYLNNLRLRVGQMSGVSDGQQETPCAATEICADGRTGQMSKKMIEAYEQGLQ